MSEFNSDFPPLDDFSTSSNTNLDSDPTTDFLAREQAVLGEFKKKTKKTISQSYFCKCV